MGYYKRDDRYNPTVTFSTGIDQTPIKPIDNTPSFRDALGAAFRQTTTIGAFESSGFTDKSLEMDYNPVQRSYDLGYGDIVEVTSKAHNDEHMHAIARDYQQKVKDYETLSKAGYMGIGSMFLVQPVDPLNWIPFIGAARAATRAGSVFKTAVNIGGQSALANVTQELIIDGSTADDKDPNLLFAAGAGAAFGALFGGVAGATSKLFTAEHASILGSLMKGTEPKVKVNEDGTVSSMSVGAAGVDHKENIRLMMEDAENNGIANVPSNVAKILNSPIPVLRNPKTKLITAKTPLFRKFAAKFMDLPYILNKNLKGEADGLNVESIIAADRNKLAYFNRDIDKLYIEWAGLDNKVLSKSKSELKTLFKRGNKTKTVFSDELDMYIRQMRAGIEPTNNHPSIVKAADAIAKLHAEKGRKLQEVGVLSENVDVSKESWYMAQRYNRDEIRKNQSAFEDDLRVDLEKSIRKEEARNMLADELKIKPEDVKLDDVRIKEYLNRVVVNNARLDKAVKDTVNKIMGEGDEVMNIDTFTSGVSVKVNKERKLFIDDPLTAAKWTTRDALGSSNNYAYKADVIYRYRKGLQELNETLPAHVDVSTMTGLRKALRDEKNYLLENLDKEIAKSEGKTKDELLKEKESIQKDFDESLQSLQDFHDILHGKYVKGDNASKFLRNFRKMMTLTYLGGVALASMPDIAMHVFRNGGWKTITEGLVPLVSDINLRKMSSQAVEDLGFTAEIVSNEIIKILQDADAAKLSNDGFIGDLLDFGTQKFSKLTLIAYWNNLNKRIAGQTTMSRIIRNGFKAADGELTDTKEIAFMASLGLNVDDLKAIAKQFNNGGYTNGKSYAPDVRQWTDKDLVELFSSAVIKNVNNTILTPSVSDIPAVISKSELAKTLFQFKSFMYSSSTRILTSSLNRRDANVVIGITALLAMGAISYATRMALAGKAINKDSDSNLGLAGTLVKEGAARSGMLGMYEILLQLITGAGDRYNGETGVGAIFGVSPRYVKDLVTAGLSPLDLKITDQEEKAFKNVLPFSNLFWLNAIGDQIGEEE